MPTSRSFHASSVRLIGIALMIGVALCVNGDVPAADAWAIRPVRKVSPPVVADPHRQLTPIDRFILARLETESLRPAPDAGRYAWLRRVHFNLIGLPPTPDEIKAFVNDTSPNAHEKIVDRLLASPAFGERWARHWLDLARYAESLGHEIDDDIDNAWRYPVHVHDLHATVLHLLGLDHTRLTFRFGGRDFRLTDVHGRIVEHVL